VLPAWTAEGQGFCVATPVPHCPALWKSRQCAQVRWLVAAVPLGGGSRLRPPRVTSVDAESTPRCGGAESTVLGHNVLPAWTWGRHLNHPASPARTTRSSNDHRPIRPLLVLPAWTAIPAGGGLSVLAGQKGARGRNVLPAWTDSGGIGASSMDGLCQQRGRFVPAAWTIPRPRSWHNDRLYPSSLERMNQHSEPGAAQITRSGIPRW
jgi:hypothetical protein